MLAVAAVACALSSGSWDQYKTQFEKRYASAEEEGRRRQIFEKNLLRYAALNAREPLAQYGPTKFSDREPSEYLANITKPENTLRSLVVNTSMAVPTSKNWAGVYTTAVKDQDKPHSCGSCWAFSAIEQIEADAHREHGFKGVLSEQELVDCTSSGEGSKRGGCGGGSPTTAYKVLEALGGCVAEHAYPYTGQDGTCHINGIPRGVKVSGYHTVGRGSESAMKSYVGATGPLSICVNAYEWDGYRGGLKSSCGSATETNHCVQIAGYGEHNGTPYWWIRNSWGTGWGINGFMMLEMNKDLCLVSIDPTATSTTMA